MVRGIDRLTRTGIAILFVGIFVIVGLGIVFTQSPEIANPFVETFNFQTSEEVFPLLRLHGTLGDQFRQPAGTPPSGTFITCLNQIDGEFCTDILEDVNKLCRLKLIAVYRFDDGSSRVVVELDGKLFLEIQDLNSLTNNFVVTHDVGARGGLPNPTNLQLDLFVDTEETSATVFKTTVSTIQPDTLVVDNDAGSSFSVNVFFTMTAYTDSEGVPECDVKEKGIFGATLGSTVKAVKVSSGEDAQFSCSIPVKGNTKTGIYEVKITSPSNTSAGSSRPQTTTTFTITLEAEDTPTPIGDPDEPCPSVAVLTQQIKDLTTEKLLQVKADLLDRQKRGTLTLCEAIQLPLVIAEVASKGLTNTPTPSPTPDPNDGLTCVPSGSVGSTNGIICTRLVPETVF